MSLEFSRIASVPKLCGGHSLPWIVEGKLYGFEKIKLEVVFMTWPNESKTNSSDLNLSGIDQNLSTYKAKVYIEKVR